MKNCQCEPSFYCPVDNLHYPQIVCEYCYQQELDEYDKHLEFYQKIEELEEWLGKKIKPLRIGKPKPGLSYPEDELPF